MKKLAFLLFFTCAVYFSANAQTIQARVLNVPNVCNGIPFLETIWGNVPGETVTIDSIAKLKNVLRTPTCDISLSKVPNQYQLKLENLFDKDTYKKLTEEYAERLREYTYEGDIIYEVKIDEDGHYISHKLSPLVHPAFKNLAEVIPVFEMKFQPYIVKNKAEATTVRVIFKVKLSENLLVGQ